ncbi:MAG: amylo-alpha-1,6-glucosidase [Candidatus Anstonellales archaeon]
MEFILSNLFGDYCSLNSNLSLSRKYHGLYVYRNNNIRRVIFQALKFLNTDFRVLKNELRHYYKGSELSLDTSIGAIKIEMPRFKRKLSIKIFNRTNQKIPLLLYFNNRNIHEVSRDNTNFYPKFTILQSKKGMKNEYKLNLMFENPKSEFLLEVESEDIIYIQPKNLVERIYLEHEFLRGYEPFDFFNQLLELQFSKNLEIMFSSSILSTKQVLPFKSLKTKNKNLNYSKSIVNRIYSLLDYLYYDQNLKEFRLLAGFHWFDSWGRDTFISLPSFARILLKNNLITKEVVCSIFDSYLSRIRNGLIPNYISETSAYNSSDASLWLINAFYEYYKEFKDKKFIESRYEKIRSIIDGYINGNDIIKLDSRDFLIISKAQTTWMDAMIDGSPITPREGKCIEINALFLNSLQIVCELGKILDKDTSKYLDIIHQMKRSIRVFWNGCYLDDYILLDGRKDNSIRPNQIIAISLPFIDFRIFSKDKMLSIIDVVEKNLLTPVGLRTLSKTSNNYINSLKGTVKQKDLCYHNGAIWPWLLYSYFQACQKINKKPIVKLDELLNDNNNLSFSHIAEIYDPSYYYPDGCIAQLWNDCTILDLLLSF